MSRDNPLCASSVSPKKTVTGIVELSVAVLSDNTRAVVVANSLICSGLISRIISVYLCHFGGQIDLFISAFPTCGSCRRISI